MNSPEALQAALDTHSREFHSARPAIEQLHRATRALNLTFDSAIEDNTNRRLRKTLGEYQVLVSALHYKAGETGFAETFATMAIRTGAFLKDWELMAQGYIRYIQNAFWEGKYQKAAIQAQEGMDQCWTKASQATGLWLASQAMRAFAANRQINDCQHLREMIENRIRRLPTPTMYSVFTWSPDQWPQAVAIAETFVNPLGAIPWYNEAIRRNPASAVHVTTLDSIHKGWALIRHGAIPEGFDVLIETLEERRASAPLDRIYRERTQKVLAELPKGYENRQTLMVEELIS